MSSVTAAGAEGANSKAANTARRTVRRIRPRFTVSQAAAFLAVAGFLLTTAGGNAAVQHHDRPVPILMYHLIAPPPADAAFPELFVRPSDFDEQMTWLASHGFQAVTLHRVYEYWLDGTRCPRIRSSCRSTTARWGRRSMHCRCCASCTGREC